MKQILVLGSLNIDLVQRVGHLPQPGETLKGGDLQIFVGGKGANQACAAARTGGTVIMAETVRPGGTPVYFPTAAFAEPGRRTACAYDEGESRAALLRRPNRSAVLKRRHQDLMSDRIVA